MLMSLSALMFRLGRGAAAVGGAGSGATGGGGATGAGSAGEAMGAGGATGDGGTAAAAAGSGARTGSVAGWLSDVCGFADRAIGERPRAGRFGVGMNGCL